MPFLLVPVVLLGAILVAVMMIPVSLVMRYRAGRTRRQARGWIAALNIAGLTISILLWLITVAFTSIWVGGASRYALAGLAIGGLLGIVGLALTRWESAPGTRGSLHFTPNAWIVLLVTLVVAARLAYGGWRTWHAWEAGGPQTSAVLIDSIGGSMAAAGIVLGYYLTFWLGVLRRLRPHQSAARHAARPRGR